MNIELKEITHSIFQEYDPMSQPGRRLVGNHHEDGLNRLIDEKTQHLQKNEITRIRDEIFGWGPITPLLENDSLFDIIIQGPDAIYVEDHNGMSLWPDAFYSPISFRNFVEKISRECKVLINQKDPFANGKLTNFRVHIVGPPIAKDFHLTLRRHKKSIMTFETLENQGFISARQRELIQRMIDENHNFLVIGPTGSGKTTLLNTIISEIPNDQRTVVIEDTDEILVSNPLHAKMQSREICPETLNPIFLEDLVKQALRMRPDRIVVGEVRGKEAKDLMQALATGHSGSMGTLHADNPLQALLRLEMLIQMGAPQWQVEAIRRLIQLSLQTIITLKSDRLNKGVESISKIVSLEKFGFLIEDFDIHNQ